MIDQISIKKKFPIFDAQPNLIYLDSIATSLKPQSVIHKVNEYLTEYSANVKRGMYELSMKATEEYERSREVIAKWIHADLSEVIFTRGTTESVNLLMYALGTNIVQKGDEVVSTIMEHHSNFVPWQQLCIQTGATLKVIELNDDKELDILQKNGKLSLEGVVTKKTKILALTHVSNVLGTVNPITEIVREAKRINPQVIVIVDGAQALPHMHVDVKELGCDFYAFSGHKMFGPTGIGVLWGKKSLLETLPPFHFGGEMVREVFLDRTVFEDLPDRFEAGTPAIAEAIGLGEAVKFLETVGIGEITKHITEVTGYAFERLRSLKGIDILSNQKRLDAGVIAFNLAGVHPHDVSSLLNDDSICVRAGNHCAMPLHTRFDLAASVRASFQIYNGVEDVDALVVSLTKIQEKFR